IAGRTAGVDSWLRAIDDARAISGADVRFVRSTLFDALAANLINYESLLVLARLGQTMPLPRDAAPTPSDLLLDALCLAFGDGDDAAAAPILRRSFAELDPKSESPIDAYTLLLCACVGAAIIGDYDALNTNGERLEQLGRDLAAPLPVYIGL